MQISVVVELRSRHSSVKTLEGTITQENNKLANMIFEEFSDITFVFDPFTIRQCAAGIPVIDTIHGKESN